MSHSESKKVLKYIKKGSVSKLRSFLKKNDVNLNEIRDSENRGVLHLACYLGECRMSRFLLRYGVDPCTPDNDGNTPLHIALNYALEFNNETVFLDLIVPLEKKSKRIMHLANRRGETPDELFGRLRTALKEELEEKRKNQTDENEISSDTSVEQQEWFEKLAFEESCENFYFKETQESLKSEKEDESYDQWAERIRREYTWKHRRAPCSNSQTKLAKQEQSTSELLTKKLAQEHQEYMNKVKLKRSKRQKEKYEQNCSNVFESADTHKLAFEQIPWPCAGSAADIVDKLSEWAGKDRLAYLKMQRVRWHPDKFAQRCQYRLNNNESERIMDLVKQISQGINMMISSL